MKTANKAPRHDKEAMDIGEVARLSKLSPSALRFYEEKGLIRSTGRSGLRRLYDPHVLEQLAFISLGRHGGFTLEEIRAMFSMDGHFEIDRKLLSKKAEELNEHIQQLMTVSDLLQHVARCSAPNHLACPKFQQLLRLAGKTPILHKSSKAYRRR